MQTQFASDGFLFQFICDGKDLASGVNGEWSLCGTNEDRMDLLKQSTFSLILAPSNNSIISTIVNQIRIFESLKSGAIPFILGGDCARLPFDDVIDWSKAVSRVAKSANDGNALLPSFDRRCGYN